MIKFERFILDNGLRVILHEDKSSSISVMNIMYDVGSKHEQPDRTGFAHLFEHLMFGGSVNIPKYDSPLQKVGGENNAFTNTDITNYYLNLPESNLETGFWLESDRMLNLAFSEKSLDVQRNVVIEEFHQNYLNQPYGDVWLLLRPHSYKVHPYQWPTIGKEPSHVAEASMEDVKSFYQKHYVPQNAVFCLSGNQDRDTSIRLLEKWFNPIKKEFIPSPAISPEPKQGSPRFLEVRRNVPQNAIYKTFKMAGRTHPDYQTCDLISDILGNGKSSRLYTALIKGKGLFSDIRAYITGEFDGGLFVIQGMVNPGKSVSEADKAIEEQLDILRKELIEEDELNKVKNQVEAAMVFSETSLLNKAINLCQAELLGDAGRVNTEISRYLQIDRQGIQNAMNTWLSEINSCTLHYLSEKV